MIAITIWNAHGRQVFGADNETLQQLYKQGVRTFPLSGGLVLKVQADLPNAADANSPEILDGQSANPRDGETTSHRSDTSVAG